MRKLKPLFASWGLLVVLLAMFIVLIYAFQNHFFRIDLTKDKRYSLADVTKNFLKASDQQVQVRVYLAQGINPGFNRLHQAVKDFLLETSVYGNINYSFPNPEKVDEQTYRQFQKEIQELQLTPVNVVDEGAKGEVKQIPVFPWAVVEVGSKRYPVRLLVNQPGNSAEQNLNASIETLEYNFMSALKVLMNKDVRKIAFLEGHGELGEDEVYDASEALSHYFQVDRGVLQNDPMILDPYDVVIIAQPSQAFSEKDKFMLDQYVMNGGKIIWLLEGVSISIDSLSGGSQTIGLYNELNLGDMLFNYGVRVNPTLVQDLQCALYPVNFANPGEKANFKPVPWYFSPLLFNADNHAITKGLSPVKSEFCSSIDLVGDSSIKKTVLLTTSGRSNVFQAPAPVDLSIVAADVNAEDFVMGKQITACLLEGKFQSVFRNRFIPEGISMQPSQMKKSGAENAMIVIADGDIIRNDVEGSGANKRVYPLGYDRFTSQNLFSNRDFILNCVNYLTDDAGWMELRAKKIPLRLLNKEEANDKRFKWQVLNVITPIALLLMGGLIYHVIRKKRYSKP